MTAITISRSQAKQLTLDFLKDWMGKIPQAQRTAPTISFDMRTWTIPQMIAQVQTDTDVGKRYVNSYILGLKNYIIQG